MNIYVTGVEIKIYLLIKKLKLIILKLVEEKWNKGNLVNLTKVRKVGKGNR